MCCHITSPFFLSSAMAICSGVTSWHDINQYMEGGEGMEVGARLTCICSMASCAIGGPGPFLERAELSSHSELILGVAVSPHLCPYSSGKERSHFLAGISTVCTSFSTRRTRHCSELQRSIVGHNISSFLFLQTELVTHQIK